MAVIMKIRNRFGAVIIGLIALAIVSFLLMDALNSNSSLLQGGASDAVGTVNGESIDIKSFEARYQEGLENYKSQTQQPNVDEQTALALRDQTWSQVLNELLMGKEYAELGIEVTTDELYDMVQGTNPHPQVVQAFSNPNTKQFDPNQVVMFLQNMDNDSTGQTRERWLNFEKFLKEDRLRNKYNSLVKKGLYVPTWLAKAEYEVKNATADFDFVYLPYSEVKDEEVKVSDDDIENFINKNKGRFTQEESRSLEYVTFDIKPNATDTAKALSWLQGQLGNFSTAESDSIFVKLYSDKPYDEKFYGKDELVSSVKDTFFSIAQGTIVGPYFEEGYFVAAKLVERKNLADSLEARHILLVPTKQEEIEAFRTLADSLKTAIEGGSDFVALAAQFSKDDKTAQTGGSWGVVKPGEKFENIDKDLFFKYKQGDVFVTPSNEGFHVIQITKAVPVKEAVKVAFLARQINASQETQRNLFADASKFASANNTLEKFRNSSKKEEIKKAPKILRNDYTIFGLGTSREAVRWGYEASKGDVSNVFSTDDKYIVVAVANVFEKGLATVENVREEVKPEVIKEKKAALLADKVKATGATSLSQLATKLSKEVLTAGGVNFSNNFLQGAGQEPRVANRAFALTANALSEAIQGENGVYVISLKATTPAAATSDYTGSKQQIKMPLEQRVESQLFEALKKVSDVKDERYKFY
jgi:peptidyl-prolyl cis-trans isomerase D